MINAEFLLQFQRCQRRSYLDIHGDYSQRDETNELLLKLQQDRKAHRAYVMAGLDYQQPNYPPGDWISGAIATEKFDVPRSRFNPSSCGISPIW